MAEMPAPDLTIEKPPQHCLSTLRLFPSASCSRPVKADSVLPTAEFQSLATNAVTIQFMQVFFMQVLATKIQKRLKEKRRKLWLREHS